MRRSKKKVPVCLRISPEARRWLRQICAKQIGHVSQGTMVERIFSAAKKNPKLIKAV